MVKLDNPHDSVTAYGSGGKRKLIDRPAKHERITVSKVAILAVMRQSGMLQSAIAV